LLDIDNDIEIIWKQIKEFDDVNTNYVETEGLMKNQTIYEWAQQNPKLRRSREAVDYKSIPLPPPPLPPKLRKRSSSLSMEYADTPPKLPTRSSSLSRSSSSLPGGLKSCLKSLEPKREKSCTPSSSSRVSWEERGKEVQKERQQDENPFEWVDFKMNEGLPMGVILPEDCLDNNSDDEEYFSAEENGDDVDIIVPVNHRHAATQTDFTSKNVICIIM